MIKKIGFGLLGFCGAFSAFAEGGQGTGNGGDRIAMEFQAVGKVIIQGLTNDTKLAEKFKEVSLTAFAKAMEDATVRGTDDLLRDHLGNSKTAINFKQDEEWFVLVNKAEFDGLSTLVRQQLIFHEYLGVMGLELSDDYRISSRLDVVLSRPLFGLCTAKRKRTVCTIGIRFDPATRSLDGAYSCHVLNRGADDSDLFGNTLLINDALVSKNAEWKWVKIWPKAQSYGAGFAYQDRWIQFEVTSPPSSGLRLPFTMKKRGFKYLWGEETVSELKGSCVLNYD